MSSFGVYTIVGFDLRKRSILDLGRAMALGEHLPTDGPEKSPYPATISDQTWPRSPACEGMDRPERNGVNLLWLPDAHFLDAGSVSVAFSLRSTGAAFLEKKSWVLPIDEGYLNKACGWQFLGYDVADACLGYSGFYGFTWKPRDLALIFAGMSVTFNRRGLLENEETALRVAEVFTRDPGTQSHAPFYPVRVWIQAASGDEGVAF